MPSILRSDVQRALYKLIETARDEQRKRAAAYDDNTHRLVGVQVPQWLYDALKSVLGFTAEDAHPKFLGQPITVGEHEEIRILWWDITMALDVGAPVQRAPFSAM